MILVTPQCPEIQCSLDHGNRLNHGTTCCGFDKGSCLSPCLAWTWLSSTPCWECERHQFFSRTTDFCIYGALKNWTHLTHLKTSLEPVDIYVRIRGPRQRGSRSFRNLSGRLQIRENSAHKFSRKCGRSNILRLSRE